MAVPQVVLSGTINNPGYPTSSPAQLPVYGELQFRLLGTIRDPVGGSVVANARISAPIVAGVYSITVFATDAPGMLSVAGLMYEISIKVFQGQTAKVYSFGRAAVPAALVGAGAGLDDLTPVLPQSGDLLSHIQDTGIHSGGRSLGSTESAIDFSAASSVAGTDVPGMQITVQATGKQISLDFGGFMYSSGSNWVTFLDLYEDNVQISRAGALVATASGLYCGYGHRDRTPSPGSHVYKMKVASITTGATLHAFGFPQSPLQLWAVEHP